METPRPGSGPAGSPVRPFLQSSTVPTRADEVSLLLSEDHDFSFTRLRVLSSGVVPISGPLRPSTRRSPRPGVCSFLPSVRPPSSTDPDHRASRPHPVPTVPHRDPRSLLPETTSFVSYSDRRFPRPRHTGSAPLAAPAHKRVQVTTPLRVVPPPLPVDLGVVSPVL